MSSRFVTRRRVLKGMGSAPLLSSLLSPALLAFAAGPARAAALATPKTLPQMMADAAPGDVIEMAPGRYTIMLDQVRFEPKALTLKAADPTQAPRIAYMELRGVAGLHLEGIVFRPDEAIPFEDPVILGAGMRDIVLRNCRIEGVPNQKGFGAGFGIRATYATNCRVENTIIQNLYRGAIFSKSKELVIYNCLLQGMASDGLDFAQVRDVRIERNTFRDFRRSADSKAHPDMIQFWTRSTSEPSANVMIRGNLMMAGQGMWTQSIFMRNEVVDSLGGGPEMFYQNIVIEQNLILNAHLHGITVGETQNLRIRGNTLVKDPQAAGKTHSHGLWTPRINVSGRARNVEIRDNITSSIHGHTDQSDWSVQNNLMVQNRARMKPGFYGRVFGPDVLSAPSDPVSFLSKAGTDLAQKGLGAGPNVGAGGTLFP